MENAFEKLIYSALFDVLDAVTSQKTEDSDTSAVESES